MTITPVVTGLTATNYSFSPANGTITIEKAVLTITANNQTVSYGTPVATVTGAGSYIPTGFVNGESASVIGGSAAYTTTYTATTAAATAGVTITPVVTGLTATNYSFSPANGTITIEKAVLTITANNQTVSYGTPVATVTGAGSYTPTGFVNGESASVIGGSATYTTTYTATTAAATAGVTITPVVTGLTATNYSFSPANGTITIEKAVLTITANNQTVSYGTPVATVTGAGSYIPTGFVNGESASVIGGSATYTTTYTATTAAATAGVTITPVVTGLTATNYSFSPANGTITIEKAVLTITANNQTVSYGTPVATVTGAGSYIPTGFVNGESASVIGGSATYTTTYTATTAAATAGVTITPVVTGLTATNYSFSPANGTITIEKAVLTITANNQTVSYGTPVATVTGAGSYIPTGFVNGESASVIGGSATYTTTYTATTAAASCGVGCCVCGRPSNHRSAFSIYKTCRDI